MSEMKCCEMCVHYLNIGYKNWGECGAPVPGYMLSEDMPKNVVDANSMCSERTANGCDLYHQK